MPDLLIADPSDDEPSSHLRVLDRWRRSKRIDDVEHAAHNSVAKVTGELKEIIRDARARTSAVIWFWRIDLPIEP